MYCTLTLYAYSLLHRYTESFFMETFTSLVCLFFQYLRPFSGRFFVRLEIVPLSDCPLVIPHYRRRKSVRQRLASMIPTATRAPLRYHSTIRRQRPISLEMDEDYSNFDPDMQATLEALATGEVNQWP